MLLTLSLIALLSCAVDGRVSFAKSEVLDNVDLQLAMTVRSFHNILTA